MQLKLDLFCISVKGFAVLKVVFGTKFRQSQTKSFSCVQSLKLRAKSQEILY